MADTNAIPKVHPTERVLSVPHKARSPGGGAVASSADGRRVVDHLDAIRSPDACWLADRRAPVLHEP